MNLWIFFSLFLLNIDLSLQRCSSNAATTECDDVTFSRGNPLKLDSYKSYLQFKHGGKIKEIPTGTFKFLQELTTLYISFNTINKLEVGAFQGLTKLQKLVLSHNEIESINNGVFRDCEKLILLDLGGNKIKIILDDAFAELVNLEEIILSFNQLDSIPKSVSSLAKVKRVNLSNNKIKSVDLNIFPGLSLLENLNLESNKISVIPGEAFRGLTKLKEINLKDNYLSNLNTTSLLNHLKSLKEIKLNVNDFVCTTLKSIIQSLQSRNVKVAQGFSKSNVTINGIACKQ